MTQDPFAKIMRDLAIVKSMLRVKIAMAAVLMVEAFAFGKL
jgi:hypothetical protein